LTWARDGADRVAGPRTRQDCRFRGPERHDGVADPFRCAQPRPGALVLPFGYPISTSAPPFRRLTGYKRVVLVPGPLGFPDRRFGRLRESPKPVAQSPRGWRASRITPTICSEVSPRIALTPGQAHVSSPDTYPRPSSPLTRPKPGTRCRGSGGPVQSAGWRSPRTTRLKRPDLLSQKVREQLHGGWMTRRAPFASSMRISSGREDGIRRRSALIWDRPAVGPHHQRFLARDFQWRCQFELPEGGDISRRCLSELVDFQSLRTILPFLATRLGVIHTRLFISAPLSSCRLRGHTLRPEGIRCRNHRRP